jgi:Mrp family chromosome partitioning ATPase
LFGIASNLLFQPCLAATAKRAHAELVSSIIKSETDSRQREGLAACAVSLFAQHTPEDATWFADAIETWDISTKRLLLGQIEEVTFRRCVKSGGPRLYSVFSQKGGVGKSTIAVATAFSLTALGRKVCLVELDFGGPTFDHFIDNPDKLYMNEFIDRYSSNVDVLRDAYVERFQGKLPMVGKLAVWPADPRWEAQAIATASPSPMTIRRIREESLLEQLADILSADFDDVVLDTPAEVKDIALSVCTLVAQRRGCALLVASRFTPSYEPLIEHYWRLLAIPGLSAALILNKVRPLDLCRTSSLDAFVDNILSEGDNSLRIFGLNVNSPALLRCLLAPRSLRLVRVSANEEVERASTLRGHTISSQMTPSGVFGELFTYLSTVSSEAK